MSQIITRLLITTLILSFHINYAFAVIGGVPSPSLERQTVMVLSKAGELCSGAVISRSSILTAAHCVHPGPEYAIHFRDASGKPILLMPKEIIAHPDYVRDAITRRVRSIDLAIVNLREQLPSTFQPVEISREKLTENNKVTIGGYGLTQEKNRTSNGKFFKTQLTVIEPYGPSKILLWLRGEKLTSGAIYSGGCHGDSGGPIFYRDKLIAITTWTTGLKGLDCGELTQGALIAPNFEWISKHAQ